VKVDELMGFIIDETVDFPFPSPEDYQTYLTGSTNFRFEIAKSYPYKGNRKATEKPKHLGTARDHMINKYEAVVSVEEEADDLISKAAAALNYNCVVASIDKDMLQLPCWHFNFGRNEWLQVDPKGGTKFFYHQILTGDRADNIVGLHGIGPKKADKLLQDCHTEEELWEVIVKAYDGDLERIIENARLLWLRRYDNEMWEPPQGA
jgi:DNA polymerase-1